MFRRPSKFLILVLALIVIVLSILNIRSQKDISGLESENKILSDKYELLVLNLAPMCSYFGCPEYHGFDTDGDGDLESVVEIPIAMTKGAGTIWIIDNGKIVFKHEGGANIGYKVPCYYGERQDDNICNGIFISYTSEYDKLGLNPSVWATEEWRYENGEYILKDTKFEKD